MQQQMSFLDISSGRTSLGLLAPTKARTTEKSLKKSPESKTVLPMFLDLRAGSGNLAGRSWEMDSLSLGAFLTHNFGECPKDAEESTLSQILEENVDPKYYLSERACRGVLRRAVNRGKELPTLLKIALCLQGKLTADEIREMRIFKEGETINLKIPKSQKNKEAFGVVSKGNGEAWLTKEYHMAISTGGGQLGQSFACALVFDARGNGDGEIIPTLTGDHEDRVPDYTAFVVAYDGSQITQKNCRSNPKVGDPCGTLCETGAGRTLLVFGIDTFNQSCTTDKAKSLMSHCDSDGLPVVICFHCTQDPITSSDIAPCLSAGNSENGQAMLGICYIDYAAFNQGVNAKYDFGVDDKTAFTLTANGPGAVCFAIGNGQADQLRLNNKVGALNCMHDEQAVLFIGINGDKAGTLDASYYKGCGAREGTEREIVACAVKEKRVIYVYVRRLAPTECARLQGMPDWWCSDVLHADAPEYKMWGNGMALPNILFVMEGIAEKGEEATRDDQTFKPVY